MLVTCQCTQCGNGIQFDIDEFQQTGDAGGRPAGQTIPCPHCGKPTTLFIPSRAPKPEIEFPPPRRIKMYTKARAGRYPFLGFLLRAVALPMLVFGSLLIAGSVYGFCELKHDEFLSPAQHAGAIFALVLLLVGAVFITLAGIAVFEAGSLITWKFVCSGCGNKVADRESSVCPCCQVAFPR